MDSTVKPAQRATGQLRPETAAAARSGPRGTGMLAQRDRGFTLIELIITVVAIGILATIAYPSYVGYKVRANRAATQAFMIDLASRQQLYFLDARRYAGTLSGLGAGSVPPEIAAYYSIPDPVVNNAAAPPTFILSALARAGTIQAGDGDLGINSAGVRSGRW